MMANAQRQHRFANTWRSIEQDRLPRPDFLIFEKFWMRLRNYKRLLYYLFCVVISSYIFETDIWFLDKNALFQFLFELGEVFGANLII